MGSCRWLGHNFAVQRRVRWFEWCVCLRCGAKGWRVRAAGEGDT